MSIKKRKVLLKIELLVLENLETIQLFDTYNKKFVTDFEKELKFISEQEKQHQKKCKNTANLPPKEKHTNLPAPHSLTQKIYRNLAKFLHPDTSEVVDCEEVFKRLVTLYERDDIIGIISLASEYDLKTPDFSKEDFDFIEKKIASMEKKINAQHNTIAWLWGQSGNDKELAKKRIYQTLQLDEEKYKRWCLENQ